MSSQPLLRDTAAPPRRATTGPDDWDARFDAVTRRLRVTVAAPPPDTNDVAQQRAALARIQACVQDCVAALDQLHAALSRERVDRRRLRRAFGEARASERRALHQAHHDELTTLPNRSFFLERLDRSLKNAGETGPSLALLYIDLDRLKSVNDEHGHAHGDEVLRVVGSRLRRAVRTEDMVSRLGGDEFACLLDGPLARAQLELLAGTLFDAVAAPIGIGALTIAVTPSIGIATCPADGADASTLLRSADRAMYRAKRTHCRHAFYDPLVDL